VNIYINVPESGLTLFGIGVRADAGIMFPEITPAPVGSPSDILYSPAAYPLDATALYPHRDQFAIIPNLLPGTIVRINGLNVPTEEVGVSGNFQVLTPEPTTALLIGLGLVGLGAVIRGRA
jgi:hypothetical protein